MPASVGKVKVPCIEHAIKLTEQQCYPVRLLTRLSAMRLWALVAPDPGTIWLLCNRLQQSYKLCAGSLHP